MIVTVVLFSRVMELEKQADALQPAKEWSVAMALSSIPYSGR